MYLPVNAKKGNLGENSSVNNASLHRWESENQVTHTHIITWVLRAKYLRHHFIPATKELQDNSMSVLYRLW